MQETETQLHTEEENVEAPATKAPASAPKKKNDFWIRLAVGIAYMGILIGFFFLKILVNDFLFDFIVLGFSVLGTLEILRALKDKMHVSQRALVLVFTTLTIITFCVSDFYFKEVRHVQWGEANYTPLITLVIFITGLAAILGLLVFAYKKVDLQSTGYTLLAYVYPSVFLLILAGCNHLVKYSEVAILFIFLICPLSDSLALVFGRLFGKKLPKKMSPEISPNKTVIGGIGGLVGGVVGAIVVFFVYYGICFPLKGHYSLLDAIFNWEDLYLFVGVGVIASFFSQFGDLVESAIKRKLGIKDMGKMLPGHGGLLDRIDSSLYAGLVICLIFTIRIMTIM